MFGVLFGWRKASKCKKVIKEAQCRLKLLKSKRHSIVKHLREDTANLIKIGHEDIALTRAEQLIKDESVAVAYELIDNFFDFVRTHFSYIRRHKDCPEDVNEAVSSLIYASARCGDLPELRVIRELFEERYGHKLAAAAVDRQMKEALETKFVSDEMKLRMVNEIATDYCLHRQPLALEYYPEVKETIVEESSSESLPGFPEETMLVYLDDVVEEKFSSPRDNDRADSKDTRAFKFKSPELSKRVSFRHSFDRNYYCESSTTGEEESSADSSDSLRRRSRRRLVYPPENRRIRDSECTSYYAQPRKLNKPPSRPETKEIRVTPSASNRGCGVSCRTRKSGGAEYSRAETMPVERSKNSSKEEFLRSNSCPIQEHPNHVHPKLPDYDQLTATFMALKQEFLMNNNDEVGQS